MTRMGGSSPRRYKRVDRLNEVLREVVADELERIGDDEDRRLRLVTITAVETHAEVVDAVVWFSTLGDETEVAAALEKVRYRLQKAIAAQVKARRTPILTFKADSGVIAGRRIDEVLAQTPRRAADVTFDPSLYKGAVEDVG